MVVLFVFDFLFVCLFLGFFVCVCGFFFTRITIKIMYIIKDSKITGIFAI